MYDTIHFWLNRVEVENDIETSALYLSNARETVNRDTGEIWHAGNLDNLRVTVSMAGVSIKGSLAKFYFPDNAYTLNCKQVKDAIGKLSDTLHLDLSQANITRLDVSTNFIMRNDVSRYFNVLGACTYFNRVQATNNTLYYQNAGKEPKKTLVFYDKAREVANRHRELPDVLKATNLLRYESRWNTRLPQQLKMQEVRGHTLFDRQFYSKIINLWAENYFKIDKKRIMKMDAIENIKTVSEATEFICAIALQKLQPDEVKSILNDIKQSNVFNNRSEYTRLAKKIKNITSKTTISESSDLVKELDGEIRQVLAYKR